MSLLHQQHLEHERRTDYRAALAPWMLAEIHRDRASTPEPYKIETFLLYSTPDGDGSRKPHDTPDDGEAFARAMLEGYKLYNTMAQATSGTTFMEFAESSDPASTVENARMPWDDALEAEGAA